MTTAATIYTTDRDPMPAAKQLAAQVNGLVRQNKGWHASATGNPVGPSVSVYAHDGREFLVVSDRR